MTTRKELTEALRARYRSATFGERIKILDEFVALTGYHGKHSIGVLGGDQAQYLCAYLCRLAASASRLL